MMMKLLISTIFSLVFIVGSTQADQAAGENKLFHIPFGGVFTCADEGAFCTYTVGVHTEVKEEGGQIQVFEEGEMGWLAG